jgi:hypothetical protein
MSNSVENNEVLWSVIAEKERVESINKDLLEQIANMRLLIEQMLDNKTESIFVPNSVKLPEDRGAPQASFMVEERKDEFRNTTSFCRPAPPAMFASDSESPFHASGRFPYGSYSSSNTEESFA